MFKKPLKDRKTSAPLRASDRRKFRGRVVAQFCPDHPDDGSTLVPDGMQSLKLITHAGEPGVVYSSPDGEPLWFSIGKNSEELIPTLYALWKRPTLIPSISTPSAVVPVLLNGADLMAAGIVEMTSLPKAGDIVCVTPWTRGGSGSAIAIGRMNFDGKNIAEGSVNKGKAVSIMHTWKDNLWATGPKTAPPEVVSASTTIESSRAQQSEETGQDLDPSATSGDSEQTEDLPSDSTQDARSARKALTADEISSILRDALLQAIKTSGSKLPSSAFPIPASTFYTNYILPARPFHVTSTSPPVDIKHSNFKSFGAFLKQAEKQRLLRLKDARGDVSIAALNLDHEDVTAHAVYRTVGDLEIRAKKQKEKAEQHEQEEQARGKQMHVVELWKPHTTTIKLFEEAQLDTSTLYTLQDLRAALNTYISRYDLVNKAEQQFVNADVDPILRDALWPQTGKSPPPIPEFAKREELLSTLCSRMQPWYRIQVGSSDPTVKRGQLQPISVVVKIRQGRKACTLVTGHEQFHLSSNAIAEALRSRCASATSVTPIPGRTAGEEVMVQGKQIKAVVDYLEELGVSKRWVRTDDTTEKKKK